MAGTCKISEIVILMFTVSVVNSAPIPRELKTLNAVSKVAENVLNLKRQKNDATPGPLPEFSELQDMKHDDIIAAATEAKADTSTHRKSEQNDEKSENHYRTSATIVLLSVLALSKPTPTAAKVEDITTSVKTRLYTVDENIANYLRDKLTLLPAVVVLLCIAAFFWYFETLYNNYMRRRRRLQEDEIALSQMSKSTTNNN